MAMGTDRHMLRSAQPWGYVKAMVLSLAKGEEMTFGAGRQEALVLISGALSVDRPGLAAELVLAGIQGPVRIEPGTGTARATALSAVQVVFYSES